MSDQNQFKNFTTRRFRADLHYRLRLLAAKLNKTQESIFNDVVEIGVGELERGVQRQESVRERNTG